MLKSLTLDGFKSFADKTRLEFPAGVTVVVGPNGSGKSNVVDAMKWVLGSQSPRGLRGQEMTDVIFNGSASRRPQNAAEVTLAFANPVEEGDGEADEGRRRFPIDEDELRLTRRVYRSGESEYLINGRASRLRDFRELLAGTGVGPDSYSIIEQGRVDGALRASPTERRALFEEAAGISRFRLKRREADKRLERVEQNLSRLRDIVDEVEGRLSRVRSQASKASRYREQAKRLREVRTDLGLADWRALAAEQSRLDEQRGLLASTLESTRAQVAEQEALLSNTLDEPDSAAALLRAAETELASVGERLSRDASVVEYERRRCDEAIEEEGRRREALLAAEVEASRVAESDEPDALAAAEAAIAEIAATLEAAESRVAEASESIESTRGRLVETRRSHDQQSAERTGLENRRQRISERIAAAERSLREATGRSEEASRNEAESTEELAKAEARRREHAERLEGLEEEQGRVRTEHDAARRALTDRQRELAENRGRLTADGQRLDTLAAEERRLEKLNRDVRLLVETDEGRAPLVFGLVADVLHVDVDLATMVEAALGDRTSHVVVDSSDPLVAALADRREDLSARVGFQRLDAVVAESAIDRADLSGEQGVMGRADEFVEAEPRYHALLQRLLGRTWFVDHLATALRLSRSVGRGLQFVTHAGEVVAPDGSVIVGPPDDIDSALTRRREAERLRAEVASLNELASEQEREIEDLGKRVAAADRTLKGLREKVVDERAAATAASSEAAALQERRRHAGESRVSCSDAVEHLNQTLESLRADEATTRERLAAITPGLAESAAKVESLLAEIAEAEAELHGERARRQELSAAIEVHRGVAESLRGGASPVVSGDADSGRQAAFDDWLAARERVAASRLELLAATSRVALDAVRRDRALASRRDAARRDREERRRRRGATSSLAELRSEAEELLSRKAQVDLRLQQIQTERRTLAERMREDYEIDLPAIASKSTGEAEEVDREALRREAEDLRRRVNAAGPVNLESIEELDELEQRFEQLSAQYDDLTSAKASLTRLTSRINADSRGLYLSSFEVIRGHFQELFGRMFGGGEADLVLVGDESDDPLERGVDIVARPPGKQLRNLTLLSGGEKTLTCVALLLALFRSKPSPFCVLDEVDAALDESNIGRFTSVIGEFLASTQFLVITHSKRTMIGADTLYGVTMQESGVSKQVSVRFEDVSEDGQIRLRRGGVEDAGDQGPARRAA